MSDWIDLEPYAGVARQFSPETGMFRAELGGKPLYHNTMQQVNDAIDTFNTRLVHAARRKLLPVHATLLLKTRTGFILWEGDILGLSASNIAGETVRVKGEKPDAHWGTLHLLTPGDAGQYDAVSALVDELVIHLNHVERLNRDLDRIQRSLIAIRVPFVTRVDEAMETEPEFLAHLKATLDDCTIKKEQ